MGKAEYLVLGLAGVAAWLMLTAGKRAAGSSAAQAPGGWVAEVFDGVKAWGNGWRYFDNGTAIDPAGNYYHQGQLVYKAGA